MLMELLLDSSNITAVYTVYVTLLISMTLSVWLAINPKLTATDSRLFKISAKPSDSEAAFKSKSELGIKLHILILKRIKVKIDPGEEAISISSP